MDLKVLSKRHLLPIAITFQKQSDSPAFKDPQNRLIYEQLQYNTTGWFPLFQNLFKISQSNIVNKLRITYYIHICNMLSNKIQK
ncbi:unnamed protein product [Paramecium octaurelia]|uniref:Uncharacterized protein n=1 Tax=Paramecium octaurelia TaxID=43137 RepID=A0A8S1YC58_PAROT|nr:unnamed protein product [Paramecium octaurelia]